MIEIISKSNGPRKEDAAAKHFLKENAATINQIANQLSGGRMRGAPSREPVAAPNSKLIRPAPRRDADQRPYTKISLNGRVIVVDFNSGRQLHHIGEFRGAGLSRWFVLATAANGFFAPLDDNIAETLRDLDGWTMPDEFAQEALARAVDERLGYVSSERGEVVLPE